MDKTSNISTRLQMLRISFQENTKTQTKELINNWSIRDLYDIIGHVEISEIVDMKEGKLNDEQLQLVLDVLNDKGNEHKNIIWKLIVEIGELLEDEDNNEDEIQWRVKLVNKLKNELPRVALQEIASQFPEWKRYFKMNWLAIRKKYLHK